MAHPKHRKADVPASVQLLGDTLTKAELLEAAYTLSGDDIDCLVNVVNTHREARRVLPLGAKPPCARCRGTGYLADNEAICSACNGDGAV